MKKSVIISLLISLTLVFSAQAQTSSAPTVEELQKQIQLLLSQMSSLQKEITALKSTPTVPVTPTITPSPTIPVPAVLPTEIDESEVTGTESLFIPPPTLTRSLFRGSRGEDVRQLQEFLAQDSTIYPEGIITGYYGIGTEAAIKRWQAKNGIPAVGVVGRQTIAKFKTFVATYSPFQPTKPEVTPPISKPEPDKIAVCPALATVDACPAGEERIVTYKSAQCGVYYACKPRENTRTDNTNATLKKVSSIQTDNRYSVNLYDPEGVQKFTIINAKGAEIHYGYPACRKEWTSPTFSADSAEFPLKLSLNDCASSQYSTTLNTSVVVKPISEGLTFPYTFANGKIVSSSNEARSYCYANGPGSGQSVAAECETKFGVVYTNVTTTTTSSGRAIYLTDAFSSCMSKYGFLAEAKQIKTWSQLTDPIPWSALTSAAQNAVPVCEREYYGQGTVETGAAMCADGKDNDGDGFIDAADSSCGTDYAVTPPSGQKEQVWNSLGLKSWVKADADSARIAQLKSTCASVPSGSNIWTANAGNYSSADFGMPDSAKCQRASSCTASQYFDGAACVSGTQTTTTTTTTGSCSQYGSGWHTMGSDGNCFDTNMTIYRTANGTLYSCAATPTTGCSGTTTTTTTSGTCDSSLTALLGSGCHYMYNDSSGNQTFCDGPMTKSAKRGDTATTAGCSSSTTVSWPTDQSTCSSRGYFWCTGSSGGSSWCQNTTCPSSTTGGGSTYAGDANSCPGFAYSRWDSSSPSRRYCQLNNETKCDYNYPSYLTNGANYTAANCPSYSSTTGSNTSTWCSPLGSDWTVYGNYCLNSSRTQYTSVSSPYASSVQSCTGADSPVTGCTPPSGSTTTTTTTGSCSQYGDGWHVMGDNNCYNSGMTEYRTANGTLYSCSSTPSSGCSSFGTTSSTSCGSGYYWNGSTCVANTTSSSSCSTPSNCYDSAVCASSGWYWYNGGCWSSPQSNTTSSSTTCSSGQYWNGTACVTTSTTDCPSGQYWSGSACVSSTTTSSSCPSGYHSMGSYCMSDSNATQCQPTGGGAIYTCSSTPTASVYDVTNHTVAQIKTILRSIQNTLQGLR